MKSEPEGRNPKEVRNANFGNLLIYDIV
jgi:hypothetical protein